MLPQTKPNSSWEKFNSLDTLFLTRGSNQLPKGAGPENFEEPWKQERRDARLRKFNFLQYFHKNLDVDSKPFNDLLNDDDVPFKWTKDHKKLFQNIKDRIIKETILAVPKPKYPFHIYVESTSIGTGSNFV